MKTDVAELYKDCVNWTYQAKDSSIGGLLFKRNELSGLIILGEFLD